MHKGANLPNDNHVVRYASKNKLIHDGNGTIVGIYPQAIKLKEGELGLSVNWLEYFSGNRTIQIELVVKDIRTNRDVRPSSAFAIANVDNLKSLCADRLKSVRVVYAPTKGNPSHSEIINLPSDDLLILEAIATEAFTDIVLNANIPN